MNKDRSLLGVCQVGVSPKSSRLTAESCQRRQKVDCFTSNATAYPRFGGGMIPNSSSELLFQMFLKNYTFSSRVERTFIIMVLIAITTIPSCTVLFPTLENTGVLLSEVLCWLFGPTIPSLTALQVLWTNFAGGYSGDVAQQPGAPIAALLLLPQR